MGLPNVRKHPRHPPRTKSHRIQIIRSTHRTMRRPYEIRQTTIFTRYIPHKVLSSVQTKVVIQSTDHKVGHFGYEDGVIYESPSGRDARTLPIIF